MENYINSDPSAKKGTEKSTKDKFQDLILASARHQRRLTKLSDIDRDKKINKELTKRIEQADDPFVKSSLWFKLFRTFEIQSELLPKTTATKKGASFAELNIVDSSKDLIYEDGNYGDTYLKVNNDGYRKEGITFVEIGYNQTDDFIALKRHEFANVFTDYDKDTIATDQSDEDPNSARWAAVRVGMELGQALQIYPEMEGKITKGDFVAQERSGVLNSTAGNTFSPTATDKVYLYYCWSIINDEPEMIVFCGGNAEVAEYHKGKDYPHWVKRSNGKAYAYVPLVDMHFTRVGEGICTMSQIGVMADVAGADQKISNIALPGIKKVVNKIVAVFGPEGMEAEGADAYVRDALMLAQERQSLGINPLVPLPAGTTMQTISPDSGIIGEYASARQQIYEIASDRFDIDFQRLSNDDVKATVFVGKTKTELQAISGLYKLNRSGYNRIAEYSIGLAANNWRITEERTVDALINEASDDSVKLNASVVIASLKDWTGRFTTDVDIRIPLSTADKSAAMLDLNGEEFNIYYGRPWNTIEEIQRDLIKLNQRARLAGLEDYYKMSDLLKKAQSIVQKNAAAAQTALGQQEQSGVNPGEGASVDNVNQDVQAELAPQRALAEAGVL